jgi:diaminopimelate epimerase
VAIAMHKINKTTSNLVYLPVEGGRLEVSFKEDHGVYKNVYLKGPATFVFKGSFEL